MMPKTYRGLDYPPLGSQKGAVQPPPMQSASSVIDALSNGDATAGKESMARFMGMQHPAHVHAAQYRAGAAYDQFGPAAAAQFSKAPGPDHSMQPYPENRFGLLGLLNVIRATDHDLNILALGTDLTTLGLNLNSSECLYATFGSPFAEAPSRRNPEFSLPQCYSVHSTQAPPLAKMSAFSEEILFYTFYAMPKSIMQLAAAAELYKREWRYHKELQRWFTWATNSEQNVKTPTFERGSFVFFDPAQWDRVRRDNFTIYNEHIEERREVPTLPLPQSSAAGAASGQ